MSELLIGCGNSRAKRLIVEGRAGWSALTTLDIDPNAGADVLHDLNDLPLPFADGAFDEIHAYEVLEHVGAQGDWRAFFAQFTEFWRLLRPGGHFLATVPSVSSRWLWGDPGHTRAILPETLVFLSQDEYRNQVGRTRMTDYRHVWSGDFRTVFQTDDGQTFAFALQAVK